MTLKRRKQDPAESTTSTESTGSIKSTGSDLFQVIVADDSPDINLVDAERSGRLGPAEIREWAKLVGGTVEVESEPGTGTALFLRVSLQGAG